MLRSVSEGVLDEQNICVSRESVKLIIFKRWNCFNLIEQYESEMQAQRLVSLFHKLHKQALRCNAKV